MYEYPFGNGQQLNLDWFLSEWKNLLAAWEAEKNGIEGALQAEIDRAEAALADVFAARDAAAQSAANALESKNAAAQSASDASGYLNTVQQNATAAQDAARNAAQSESNAADSAQTTLASKNAAGQSERNAAQSEANAQASKDAAAQSAADALANKNAAAQSAEDALANKNAAAQSAEDAEDAASSVEASAQQIATNTTDISDLKNSFSPGNYLTIANASFKNAGSKEIDTGNYRSVLEILGNWHRVKPAPDIVTPSENYRAIFYCPYNTEIANQNADVLRNNLISENAYIVIPDNVVSISFEIEVFKRSVGTSFSALYIFTEENSVVDQLYQITIGNAPANMANYYNKFSLILSQSNAEDIFAKKKFYFYMARLFPFYDCEYCFKIIFNTDTTLTTTKAIALALEKE